MVADIWRSGLVLEAAYNTELYPPMATLCRSLSNKMMKLAWFIQLEQRLLELQLFAE